MIPVGPLDRAILYGDPYSNISAGTLELSRATAGRTPSIFLRQAFNVDRLGAIMTLLLNQQCDDGFIAWLNGVETRYNVPSGELTYNAVSSSAVNEPDNSAPYFVMTPEAPCRA
jgi:hypothetical protein